MTRPDPAPWTDTPLTARLVLADGTVIAGHGLGATGSSAGEVCFNTAMTGYQEILTDPSYAGQIITFTFPHIGNVGANDEDIETSNLAARSGVRGCVLRADVTGAVELPRRAAPRPVAQGARHHRHHRHRHARADRTHPRARHAERRHRARAPACFDLDRLAAEAKAWPGLDGMDLVPGSDQRTELHLGRDALGVERGLWPPGEPEFHVVAIDYGLKRNILRCLASAGCKVTVVPAIATAADVLDRKPDGVFLSNGPGDPAATGRYAVPEIRKLVDSGLPLFGICLGHQMLGLALGARKRTRCTRATTAPITR